MHWVVEKLSGNLTAANITSDAGGLILREVEQRTRILRKFAACFIDYRNPNSIEHTVGDLVAQRVYGLCLGYEDLNDHDELRADPLLAVMVGKTDPKGDERREAGDRGKALAGKSTLNRLELTGADAGPDKRYKKIPMQPEAIDRLMVDHFLDAHKRAPLQIVLDLDSTDDPVHGHQEGRFFHGYYDCYCYLPLYIFCGEFLLSAQLRSADVDPAVGALTDLRRIVAQIRKKWRRVPILVRGDSGFCRDAIMAWCEREGIDYVFGLAKNPRLLKEIDAELKEGGGGIGKDGSDGADLQEFSLSDAGTHVGANAACDCQGGALKERKQSAVYRDVSRRRSGFRRPLFMKRCIAHAARWKTGSRNSNWDYLRTEPARGPCGVINCDSTFPQSPTS